MGKMRSFLYGSCRNLRNGSMFGRGASGGYAAVLVFSLFCLVLSGMPFTGTAGAEEAQEAQKMVNPHDFRAKEFCPVCHTKELPKLSFDPVTTCTKCHIGNLDNHPVTKHPIGQEPRINIPYNFPLTRDGKMVCYTCHDPHNKQRLPRMLRVEYEKLCAACHVGY
jgi:predicted CXXCH cytochrome family protein